MLTTDGSLPQQLGVVWSRLLEADSEGPSFISHAACARSVSSSRTSLSCACGALSKAKRMVDVSIALSQTPSVHTAFDYGLRWGIEGAPQAQERKVRDELTNRAQAA